MARAWGLLGKAAERAQRADATPGDRPGDLEVLGNVSNSAPGRGLDGRRLDGPEWREELHGEPLRLAFALLGRVVSQGCAAEMARMQESMPDLVRDRHPLARACLCRIERDSDASADPLHGARGTGR